MHIVKRILELLQEQGTIPENALEYKETNHDLPRDMRDNVVLELLSTERKYFNDLQALQASIITFSITSYVYTPTPLLLLLLLLGL